MTWESDGISPETSIYSVDVNYQLPNATQQNITLTNSFQENSNNDNDVVVQNGILNIVKPISNLTPVTLEFNANGNSYYRDFSQNITIFTFDENSVEVKTEQGLTGIASPDKNTVYRYSSNDSSNDKIVYYDGTDFRYLDDDSLVLVSEHKIKIIVKWSELGLSDEITEILVPTFEKTLIQPLDYSKSVSFPGFSGPVSMDVDITSYTRDVDYHATYKPAINVVGQELQIYNSHLILDELNLPETVLEIELIPNFKINFSDNNNEKDLLNEIVQNWDSSSTISPSSFTFEGLTDMSGTFEKLGNGTNFPWEETSDWAFVDIEDMSDMFLNYNPNPGDDDFTLADKSAITSWFIQQPITSNLIIDLEEIVAIIIGDITNPDKLGQISYAWAELLSENSTNFSGLSWNIKKVASIYEKVARYLLGGDAMNGYNFGPIENWDVSEVKDMSGLFGVTSDYVAGSDPHGRSVYHTKMAKAIHDIQSEDSTKNYTDIKTELIGKLAEFNKDLSNWDVSNVSSFYRTFYGAPCI